MSRYHRQTLLPEIGEQGQARLASSRIVLVGCGALGGTIAEQLVRAGVGHVCLVDRDVVELSNLQRQVLFEEADARDQTPKAVAAARRLYAINSSVRVEPVVADFNPQNAQESVSDTGGHSPAARLLLDGTDNVQTRYLLNDLSIKLGVPWIYGACVGTQGRVMPVLPNESACLRCVFPTPPAPGELPTCDTAGVLGPAAAVVASLQAALAIRTLTGQLKPKDVRMQVIDVWTGAWRSIDASSPVPDCPACQLRRFEFLEATPDAAVTLCGRQTMQIMPERRPAAPIDLPALAARLAPSGQVRTTPHLLRFEPSESPDLQLTVFPDGRCLIAGVSDKSRALTLFARYVGA